MVARESPESGVPARSTQVHVIPYHCGMTRSASTPRLQITYVWYAVLIVAAATARPSLQPNVLVDQALTIASLALVGLAILGRIWCSAHIAGRKDSQLVTEGPYSLCRHPLYALSFIGGLGLGLTTRSMSLTLVTALVLGALLTTAARREEQRQESLHGAAFSDYARVTPRWWPRWSGYRAAACLELDPRLFWKAFLDAGSFLLLYMLIEAARSLRQAGLLPTLFTLP